MSDGPAVLLATPTSREYNVVHEEQKIYLSELFNFLDGISIAVFSKLCRKYSVRITATRHINSQLVS